MEAQTQTREAETAARERSDAAPLVAFDARKWLNLRAPAPPPPDGVPAGAEPILARCRLVESWLHRRPAGIG